MTKIAFKKWYSNGWASPFAGLVALWTWGKYSHVELIINTEDDISPLKMGFSASAWENEVRLKPIYFENNKWDIIETSREINMEYVASVLGDGYDFIGIGFCEFIPFKLHVKNRNYCSEAVSCAIGLINCQNDPNKLAKFLKKENQKKKKIFPYEINSQEDKAWEYLESHLNGKAETHG